MISKKKIVIGFGTRPELIKLFPLIIKLKKNFNLYIINTGQHEDLLFDILRFFKIKIFKNLNVMKKNQKIEDTMSSIIHKTSPILRKLKPSLVIVHGDTTSSLSISLYAVLSTNDSIAELLIRNSSIKFLSVSSSITFFVNEQRILNLCAPGAE